jgi:hypothetical protein
MNCFYHPNVVAVGTCKSCSKGLCRECAVDLGKGLACKGACEKDVAAVIKLIERNIQLSPVNEQLVNTARGNRYIGAVFYLIFGFLFLSFAAYQYFTAGFQPGDLLLWGMGATFLIFGLVVLKRALRFSRPVK